MNYSFDVDGPVTVAIYFQFPGSSQVYQEAYSSFTFTPSGYTSGPSAYPSSIVFIGNPGPDQTQLTLNVNWREGQLFRYNGP